MTNQSPEHLPDQLKDHTSEYKRGTIQLGIIFGLVAAVTFAFVLWGFDALKLTFVHGVQPWAKFALGFLPCLILCIAAGWISSSIANGLVSLLIWLVCGTAMAYVAGHIPFEGLTYYFQIVNPEVAARINYSFNPGISARLMIGLLICAVIFSIAGLLFRIFIENAYSAAFTGGAILSCILWIIFFFGSASVLHHMIERPLTDPVIAINRTIEYKLQSETTPFTKDEARKYKINSLNAVADLLHSPRKLILLDYDSTLVLTNVGVNFSGTWVSCAVAADDSSEPPSQQPIFCKKLY